MKIVKRANPRLDKLNKLRRKPQMPLSGHTPLTEAIGETERQIRKEIAIMKKCQHPHVVKLLEVIDDKLKSKIYLSKQALPSIFSFPYCIPCRKVLAPFIVLPPPDWSWLWNFLELIDLFLNSHGVSRWRGNSLERRV